MLSDLGSWASIIGLILSFGAGFGICKFSSKKSNQENKHLSLYHKGSNNQSNNNHQ